MIPSTTQWFEHHFPEPDTSDLTEEEIAAAYSILSLEEITVITLERLYELANEDRVMVKLKEVVLRGFPQTLMRSSSSSTSSSMTYTWPRS
jgi:hypothetical protein